LSPPGEQALGPGGRKATLPAIHQAQLVIDCRSKRAIGADHELKAGDVVKIFAKA
jgi:hypothetical protein